MFEIIFLATGGGIPSKNRALASTLIKFYDKKFLIDCGDGAQYSLLQDMSNLGDPFRIFISHEHFDHIGGLGGLMYTLDLRGSPSLLEVYAGHGAILKIKSILQLVEIKRYAGVKLIAIRPGVIWSDNHVKCLAFATDHTESSYGFIFEGKEQRHFIPEKATELGVPEGKLRSQLILGESVILPNGNRIEPDMVLSAPVKGKKVVFLTDAVMNPNLIELCYGADCLIAEATYLESDFKLAVKYKHLTAKTAAILAKEAEVKALYLNHISTRYSDKEILDEAAKEFIHVFLTSDHQNINI
jgi:ribonuclease Z